MKKWYRRFACRDARLALIVAALAPAAALAQPCCATASALFPGRLSADERVIAGVMLGARTDYGSFDGLGRHWVAPPGDVEVGFEQRLLASVAVVRRLQLAIAVPFVQTYRSAAGYRELGGGLGDAQFGARGIAFDPGGGYLPGVALLASVTAPTGFAADEAHHRLATDATGQGSWQLGGGVALEEWVGEHVVLELTASLLGRVSRTVGNVHSQLAPQLLLAASGAWLFSGNRVLAMTVTFSREGDASVNGARVPGSGRGFTSVGVFGALPFGEGFRVQGSIACELPVLGIGQSTGVQVLAVLLKAW